MKITKLIAILSLLLFIISCNEVRFDKPMLIDGKPMVTFNKTLIGNYYLMDSLFDSTIYNERYYPKIYKTRDSVKTGSVIIFISENIVRYTATENAYYDTTQINLNEITLDLSDRNDKKNKTNRKIIDNYVLIENIETDVIVNLRNKDVLKEKNGIYYINLMNAKDNWSTIQIIKEKKNKLIINSISSKDLKDLPNNFHIKNNLFSTFISDMDNEKFDYLVKYNYFKKLFSFKKE